jgi:hypothetical protein
MAMGRSCSTIGSACVLERALNRIYFNHSGLGVNGYEAEDWLLAERQLAMALSDDRSLLATFTVGNDGRSCCKLVKAIRAMAT